MLIAEEFLLLSHDDRRTAPSLFDDVPYRLAGAVLVELALEGRVGLREADRSSRAPGEGRQVVVRDATPLGHAALDRALELAAERPRRPGELVERVARQVERPLLDGLEARGRLRREERTVWGLFPTTRWTTVESPDLVALRSRVERVLCEGESPRQRMATLLAVSDGAGWTRRYVPRGRWEQVESRVRALVGSGWQGHPARDTVETVTAAARGVVAATALAVPVLAT